MMWEKTIFLNQRTKTAVHSQKKKAAVVIINLKFANLLNRTLTLNLGKWMLIFQNSTKFKPKQYHTENPPPKK